MFKKIQRLVSSRQLKELYPVDRDIKSRLDNEVKDIICRKDDRRLLIIGPCSLDESGAIFAYQERLKELQAKVCDKLMIVVRLYSAKPRSRGGYIGLMHEAGGLEKCRKIMQRTINEFGFAIADELLYPFSYDYFDDCVSYYAIGARSALSQEHRFFASGIDCVVGFKNPINGDLNGLFDSVLVCREKNSLFKGGFEVGTSGNAFAHGILRGYTDSLGVKKSNYDAESVARFVAKCNEQNINVPLVVDFSHDNSGKDFARQLDAVRLVGENMLLADYSAAIKGFMMESYLNEGKGGGFGCSLTDGCLSFERTQNAVLQLYSKL